MPKSATEILQIAENADSLSVKIICQLKVLSKNIYQPLIILNYQGEQAEKLLTELKTLVEAFHLPSESQRKKLSKKLKS